MRATANKCFLIIWCKFNQMMRTFCNTFTAGFTGFTVNNCYSVYNMNCIKRTSFYTASKSHTSIIACFGSAAWNECHHFTVFYTSIVIIVFCFFAGSCTFYKGSHTSRFNYFLSHDSGNYFAYCFSASAVTQGISEPDGYSQEAIDVLLSEQDDLPADRVRTPNFIFVQLESFFDANYLKDLTYG